MSPLTILYRLIIYPLELFFETVFYLSEKHVHNPALSILILSLVVNFLVLPLYRRADAMQEQEREMGAKMAPWLKHIRKTFKGDERFMMTQTYYRQMGYKQVYVLRSSVPLLLQIPFFIAAYHFLSHLNYLSGVKLGPIKDLAEPDALIAIGGITLNLLPILMTAINAASATVYSKGFPIKTKIQMYGIAAIFLVLLYNSPAGLVFYWTLNNLFSLGKNIVAALMKKRGIAAKPRRSSVKSDGYDAALWFTGALILTVMTGLMIPAGTIASAPQDFISLNNYESPMRFIALSFLTAAGFFIIWFGVIYVLAGSRARRVIGFVSAALAVAALIDCFFVIKPDAGVSTTLVYHEEYHADSASEMTNIFSLMCAAFLLYYLWQYKKKLMPFMLAVPLIAVSVMSFNSLSTAYDGLKDKYYLEDDYVRKVDLTLSTEGRNVVVIMLDRAIGDYIPFIMDNDPELKAQFDGFTYYSNVLSYGANTLFGAPALFGGPEYSPMNLNLRSDEKMEDKINEALLVMPVLFAQNGYDVVVTDPPYAGYNWIPDVRIYDGYDGIEAALLEGSMSESYPGYTENADAVLERQERNFFCYSLSKIVPAYATDLIYDNGNYNAIEYGSGDHNYGSPLAQKFIDSYSTLIGMDDLTVIRNDDSDHFIMMDNNMTHEDIIISSETYDGGMYSGDRFLPIDNHARIRHMQINIAAYKALADWFDHLREEGVYDNTRIILVSDHGYFLGQDEELLLDGGFDLMAYLPLLMIKDFDSEGFTVEDDFAVNALVPYLATDGIIDRPANPFTGEVFDTSFLEEEPVIISSVNFNPQENPGTRFADADWYILHGDDMHHMTSEEIPAP